jgi:hypothetical protein
MATKQSSKKQASNKSDKKKQTTKKSSRKVADKRPLQVPPIVVGGGNSTYIYIATAATQVMPSPDPRYICYRLATDIRRVRVHDGANPHRPHPVQNPRTHRTEFED